MENQPPMSNPQGITPPRGGQRPIGPIVGIVIVVLILILGGLYFWGEKLNEIDTLNSTPDAQTQILETQSNSDIATDIESDLEATVLEGLGSELENITL